MRIRVQIERLVIEGRALSPSETAVLRRALKRELSGLLATAEGSTIGGSDQTGRPLSVIRSVALPSEGVHLDAPPARLGRQIANALHEGLPR